MKTMILFFLLFFTCAYSQLQNQDELNRYERKWHNRKTTANILAITGGGLLITGIIMGNDKNTNFQNDLQALGFGALGIVSVLTSVPFYVSAHKNHKKAINIRAVTGIVQTNQTKYHSTAGIQFEF